MCKRIPCRVVSSRLLNMPLPAHRPVSIKTSDNSITVPPRHTDIIAVRYKPRPRSAAPGFPVGMFLDVRI